MLHFDCYDQQHPASEAEKAAISQFLATHLDEYGDPVEDITKAVDYSLSVNGKPGGFILVAKENDKIASAVVINKTGMEGYIPDNILVYIATDAALRGRGIGRKVMEAAIEKAEGDIALHVEPANPAKRLYESLGFTNKYLEMRLKK